MDRQEVRIKINGQEKSFPSKKNKEKKTGKTKTHIPETKTSSFPENDLPLIIVDEMAAAAEKKEEEEFEWVLPKEPEKQVTPKTTPYIEDLRNMNKNKSKGITKKQPTPISKKKKLTPPSFPKQLFLSIVMAVGIGTCLGFLILAIMNMSDKPLNPAQQVSGQTTDGANGATTENPGTTSGDQTVTLSSLGVAVLQAEVYSNSEAANAEIQKLQESGFSAISLDSELFFVFMAVGTGLDGMKEIGKEAEKKGFKPYAKEITIPEKTFSSITEQDALLLQEGQGLYKELIATSALLLQGGAIDPATVERMNGHYQKISAVKEENTTDGPKEWKTLLVGAYQNIQEYQSSKETNQLWDAQQKLLEATVFLY
ncbi:hypothetical protein [Sutcliffiella halmapala]|uniref:hypothetical protein n=1 Tax=Sutcliffiella halmapala TaxID=79882 RepID=UPI000994E114|nr:hypothetical protein [Sutcliffiella halmapala]